MSTDQFANNRFIAGINEIRSSWGWFFALGIVLMLFGAICIVNDITATFAIVLVLGWLLLVSGVLELIHASRVHTWNGFFLFLLSALWRGFIGFLLIQHPDVGAAGLTVILASFFIVGGLFRATGPAMLMFPRWGWMTFCGILSFVLGIMLLLQWPASSIWFIGFALGVDLIFDGAAVLAFAMAIHALPKFTPYKTKPA